MHFISSLINEERGDLCPRVVTFAIHGSELSDSHPDQLCAQDKGNETTEKEAGWALEPVWTQW